MKKKVLIVGGASLVGKGVIEEHSARDDLQSRYDIECTIHSPWEGSVGAYSLDLLGPDERVRRVLDDARPDVIIYAASEGNVDWCEQNKESALSLNVGALGMFISSAKETCDLEHFIYISTNAVFDGNNAPYSEDDVPNPINYYGKTKVMAEKLLEKAFCDRYSIARPILLMGNSYPQRRKSAAESFITKLSRGESIVAVDDVYCNPLHSRFLASGLWSMILKPEKSMQQIYHFGGREKLSRYDLLVRFCEYWGFDRNFVTKVSSNYFTEIAARPADTTYCTRKAEKVLGWHVPSIVESMQLMVVH